MKKWLNSLGFAIRGIILFFKTERNARIEGLISILIVLVSAWLNLSVIEWCLILTCIGAVLSAEAFNTVVERLADLQTKDHHSGIGQLKDISAGAVLITAIISIVIGMMIFTPRLLEKFEMHP